MLAPHPKLAAAHRRAIALDYGMVDGVLEIEFRWASLSYMLRRMRLDLEDLRPPSPGSVVRFPGA